MLKISRTQFPLDVAETLTVRKSQGGTYRKILLDLAGSRGAKDHTLTRPMMYVAYSRSTSAQGLYIKCNHGFKQTLPPQADHPLVNEVLRHATVKMIAPFIHLREI